MGQSPIVVVQLLIVRLRAVTDRARAGHFWSPLRRLAVMEMEASGVYDPRRAAPELGKNRSRGDGALHVAAAAPVQHAVGDDRLVRRARWHHGREGPSARRGGTSDRGRGSGAAGVVEGGRGGRAVAERGSAVEPDRVVPPPSGL